MARSPPSPIEPGERVFFQPARGLQYGWLFGAPALFLLLRRIDAPGWAVLLILAYFALGALVALAPDTWITDRRILVQTWWSSRSEPLAQVGEARIEGILLRRVRLALPNQGEMTVWAPFRARKALAALSEARARSLTPPP